MGGLLFLLFLALLLGLGGLVAFLWTVRSGQYDDLDGAALRILDDDEDDDGDDEGNAGDERAGPEPDGPRRRG